MRARDRGAVAVETAVIVSVLLVPLLIGIIDVARLIHTNIIVTEAAQEGALYLAYDENPADVATHVQSSVDPYVWTNFGWSESCVPDSRSDGDGGKVTSTVSEDVELFFPFFGDVVSLEKTAEGYRFSPCP